MTWTRYPASTWGIEAMPIDAACMVDLVRANTDHLMRNAPAGNGHFWMHGAPTSQQTSFNDASTLWRGPKTPIRAGLDRRLRALKLRVFAYVSAGSGTLRFCISAHWRIVANPPADGDQEAESAAGAVTSTTSTAPDEITLRLHPGIGATQISTFGEGAENNRGRPQYRVLYPSLQGIVNNGANTLTVQSFNIEEEDPP